MTTSGTYSFTVTRDDIIRQAMLNIQRLDPDESPTTSETSDCARVLNLMCKQWMGKADFAPGLKVWTRKRGHLFLQGNTGAYTVGPSATGWTNSYVYPTLTVASAAAATSVAVSSVTGIASTYAIGVELDSGIIYWTTVSSVVGSVVNLVGALPSQASSGNSAFVYQTAAQVPVHVETALLRDSDQTDTQLKLMTVQSYDYLPNKVDPTNISDPTAIYYERGISSATVYTDCGGAQDVSKHIVITYLEPVQDFNAAGDTPYYPQEWYLALCWGLSEQISPMFKSSWSQKMEQLKNSAIAIARNQGSENTELFFQPGAEE
jgi:hypothetical protein